MSQVKVEVLDGRGPRLLLLPGLGARGEGYRKLAGVLASHARPVLVEYPTSRHAGVGAAQLARQVMDAVGEVDAVVASSMAGLVAAHLAGAGAVRGVAFVGSFSALDQLGLRGRLFPLMAPIARFGRPGQVAASIAAWSRVPRGEVAHLVPTTWAERDGVWHRAFAVPQEPPPPALRDLSLAFVAIHGDRDPLVPVSVLGRLGKALPTGTPLHVLMGAGHVPYWTHPQELASLLRPWLGRLDDRTPSS